MTATEPTSTGALSPPTGASGGVTPAEGTPLKLLEDFLVTCNVSGIRWALLRGRATLGLPGRDVDLLVSPAHQPAFAELVREFGGVVSPGRLHPSHRSYRLGGPRGDGVVLDVVTRLQYSRRLRFESGLEEACLDRRVADGWLYELSPSDRFWTVLLHCVLDKNRVTERRARELTEALPRLQRSEDFEQFVGRVLPSDWPPQRLVECVARTDWEQLEALGRSVAPVVARPSARRHPVVGLDAVAARVHGRLWRAAGLGRTARAARVLEAARRPAAVVDVRRRPGLISLRLVVSDVDRAPIEAALESAGYRRIRGAWTRLTQSGLERVSFLAIDETEGTTTGHDVLATSLPLGGRTYFRWAVEQGPGRGLRKVAR